MALHSWRTRFFENVNIEKIERIRGDSAPNRMKDLAGESKRDQLKRIPLRSIGMKCCFKVPFIPVTRTAPERLGRISFCLLTTAHGVFFYVAPFCSMPLKKSLSRANIIIDGDERFNMTCIIYDHICRTYIEK